MVALGFGASERNWMLPYFMEDEAREDSNRTCRFGSENFYLERRRTRVKEKVDARSSIDACEFHHNYPFSRQ